ncbi:hypothetical protein Nepgr_022023 [Nepenthes gracilis]|uniref:Uncharacterized protein n=1 Tax=Nepenthes gracilis TaxID=150966 RepID=A0AAD3T043_NEPGR|nr:hypothetical protein Nepgr_022023 [Nepenthes gracilis]
MAATAIECPTLRRGSSTSLFSSKWRASAKNMARIHLLHSATRASLSVDDENRGSKELGLFALRKKIEDAVIRAETLAPTALELEETKRIRGEKLMREYNLWDDPAKSNEILVDLAVTVKVVDALKDLKYKAEEAKLITELADTDAVNCRLFKQAYKASVDVCKSLDEYEMSKLLKGSFDMQGASLFIRA